MREALLTAAAALALAGGAAAQDGAPRPDLGHPVSEADLAFWDRSIPPDGRNLPEGSGTAEQGRAIFELQCAACHGMTGAETDAPMPPLIGGIGTLASDAPLRTVGSYWPYATTVFDYIRRAMPYTAPKSLSDDEIYALTAYLLAANGIIAEDDVMDRQSLPAVEMPNRDGFVSAWPPG
jgi:cytochrome c